jgi:peptidoglycan/LPS O-acetylase OafA/YrhL
MTTSFSLFLEVVRIVATLIVFVAHSFRFFEPLDEYNKVAQLAHDGVLIFFVLSGYVITWCACEKEKDLQLFAINRAARIYSVALPGLLLGAMASLFVYFVTSTDLPYQFSKIHIYLPIYLTFTGDFWSLSETPPGNFPYWSLNYEVWYYIIFSVFFFVKGALRWLALFVLMVLVGPAILSLFPLWMAGSLLYFSISKFKISPFVGRIMIVGSVGAFIIMKVLSIDNLVDASAENIWTSMIAGILYPHQLIGDYLLAIFVVILFIGGWHADLRFGERAAGVIRYFASFSFSFYLFHMPIFTVVYPFVAPNSSFILYVVVTLASTAPIFVLARYTEHKKHVYRTLLLRAAHLVRTRTSGRAA